MNKIKKLTSDKFLYKFFFWAGFIQFFGWNVAVKFLSYPACGGFNFILMGLCWMLLSEWFNPKRQSQNSPSASANAEDLICVKEEFQK